MAARTPTLSGAGNPFTVSNSVFGAFNQGSGQDPIFKELQAASEHRYEVGLRYNNGQATEAEYQAAIAAESAVSNRMLASHNPDVVSSAQRNIAELTNLAHDVTNHAAEVIAAAVDDNGEALMAQYQRELGGMVPGSTGYIDLQRRIADMQDSITNKVAADTARQASFELATVTNAWQAGTATDEEYKAAYAKYASAQKPGTTESVNAQANLRDLTFRLDRNALVQKVDEGTSSLDDLLAFDKAHLSGMVDKGSQGYRDALDAYQSTEKAVYDRDRKKVEDDLQHGQTTPAQAIEFYRQAMAGYGANRAIVDNATDRIAGLNDAVQAKRDSDTIKAFNDGTMAPDAFIAYATTRQASFARGTAEYDDWGARAKTAKTAAVQPAILASYQLSQKAISLQQFIADNSSPAAHGTKTTTRQVLQADGTYKTVSTTVDTPPTPAEVEAWKQRQSEVADAKVQLASLQQQIAGTPNGFVSSQQMLAYWHQELGKVAVGSPEYWSITDRINGVNDRIHAEALLASGGVKIGFPSITTNGVAATQAAAAASGGGKTSTAAGSGGIAASGTPYTSNAPTGSLEGNASAFIRAAGGVDSPEMRKAVMAWFYGEGVSSSAARNNPGNLHSPGANGQIPTATNRFVAGGPLPGQTGSYYAGPKDHDVAVFGSMTAGIAAMAGNLNRNAYGYPAVKAALAANNPAGFLKAMQDSGWAENHYTGTAGQLFGVYAAHFGGSPPTSGGAAAAPPVAAAPGGGGGKIPGSTVPGKPPVAPKSNVTIDSFMRGLGATLSNGDYNTRNSRTGEFGKYQILPGNWSAWANQYLGDPNAAPTPENQEKVTRAKLTELYTKLGSWQAVAHWWSTGGAGGNPAAEGDPSTWGASDTQFVTSVIHAAGGEVTQPVAAGTGAGTHLPTAGKPYVAPTTTLTTAAGKGVASGLQAIVPGTQSKDPRSGLTTQQTVGIDFPTNLDGRYFEDLYGHIHTALDRGATSYTYKDATTGQSVNILLPDNPQGRAQLINGLDSSRIQLAQERAVAAAGTDREAAENANYTAVVKTAGENQIKLLDTEYGGNYKKGSDMFSLQAGVTSPALARGLGANPRTGPTSAQLAANRNLRDEAMSTGGMSGGLQTNSLTPIASAQIVTDYTVNYVTTQTALAQKAKDEGRYTDAITILHNIDIATDDHGKLVQQIAIYNTQGQVAVKAISGITGAETPGPVDADIAAMKASGATIAASKQKAEQLLTEIKPFLKTTATGDIVYDVGPNGATVKLQDNVVLFADRMADGSIKFEPKALPPAGYGSKDDPNKPLANDPERVRAQVPTSGGKFPDAPVYAKWHIDTIGYVKAADGSLLEVKGRVLDIPGPDGNLIVADPFQEGRWAPGPIYWTAPKGANVRLEPTTDSKGMADDTGRTAITFDGPNGTTYKLVTDDKTGGGKGTGAMLVYALAPADAARNRAQSGGGSANSQQNADALSGIGFGLSPGDNQPETLAFLKTPNINGPWVTGFDQARSTMYGERTNVFGVQLLRSLMGAGQDPGTLLTGQDTITPAMLRDQQGGGYWEQPGWKPGVGPFSNLNPFAFLFPPAVNSAGVPSSPRSIGAPPPPPALAPVVGSAGYVAAQGAGAGASIRQLGPALPAIRALTPAAVGAGAGASAAALPSMGVGATGKPVTGGAGNVQASATIGGTGNVQASTSLPKTPPPKVTGGSGNVESSATLGGGNVGSSTTLPVVKPIIPPPSRITQRPL